MTSVNQAAWVPGTNTYRFGHESIDKIPVTGAPADTNFRRWAMLHDGSNYRMYCFRGSTRNTLYQFAWNGNSYHYGHNSMPVLTLTNIPIDADAGSFAMLHSGSHYHLYLRRLGDPTTLYQFLWAEGTTTYKYAEAPAVPAPGIAGFPSDTDYARWMMLHDGQVYRHYAFKLGSNSKVYQGAWNGSEYVYGYKSMPVLELEGTPNDSNLASAAMLHDGTTYRLYMQML